MPKIVISPGFNSNYHLLLDDLRKQFSNVPIESNNEIKPTELQVHFAPSKRNRAFQIVQYLQTAHDCVWDLQKHIQSPDRFILTCPSVKVKPSFDPIRDSWLAKQRQIETVRDRLEESQWRCQINLWKLK